MGMIRFSGDDIAAAFNRPLPSTACAECGHRRGDHRREIVKPGPFDGIETHHECKRGDRRRKAGVCPCEKFTEPANENGSAERKAESEPRSISEVIGTVPTADVLGHLVDGPPPRMDRPHEFREDTDDYSMCVCGTPADVHHLLDGPTI